MPFKFSFPLPGRKASGDTNGSPILLDTPNDSHDDSPLSDPGSKAERILGTLEPITSHALSSKSSRKALRKKPSFMSVTLSETENNSPAGKDGFPFPDMPGSRGSSRRPSHNLQNQASSPLLGERFFKGSPGTDSTTNSPSPRPHFYGSSSTLRSYYDPAKSPLSISQQTSASSARDMALRKGYPAISSPLSQDVSNEISPSGIDHEGRPVMDHDSTRKPARLDLSKFSPKHQNSSLPIVSPDEVSKSPSQLSFSSSQQSASSGRPSWWTRRKTKESKSKKTNRAPDESRLDEFDLGLDSLKTNIRKPRAGARHWFDSVDVPSPADNPKGQSDSDETHRQFWNRHLDNLRPTDYTSPAGDLGQGAVKELSSREDPSSNESILSKQALLRHGSQDSLPEETPAQTRSRSSTLAKADLLNHSFLELSSSDDEEPEGKITLPEDYRRHRVQDSIDQDGRAEDALVSSAQRTSLVKPKPVVNTSPRRSKRGSEIIPPVPKIPERPQLQQRVSSMRWREIQNFKSPTITTRPIDDSTSSSGGASIASQSSSFRHASADPYIKRSAPGGMLMTVTDEEGELLEAMRQTRAGVRQDVFGGDYGNNFHGTRNNIHRPRTSGADGRASYLGSDRSISPPPSLLTTNASPQSFRFPDVPSSDTKPLSPLLRRVKPRQAPPIIFPPPKSSPTESFSPGDILPSTPRSRLSPLTPSSTTQDENEVLGNDGHARGEMRKGHLRKRTVSSGVVMLDGMEERARIWESEEEWGGVMGREDRW
ncbi:MAG: hypothetical protein Q9170_000859 [Blastenia crenularia]